MLSTSDQVDSIIKITNYPGKELPPEIYLLIHQNSSSSNGPLLKSMNEDKLMKKLGVPGYPRLSKDNGREKVIVSEIYDLTSFDYIVLGRTSESQKSGTENAIYEVSLFNFTTNKF